MTDSVSKPDEMGAAETAPDEKEVPVEGTDGVETVDAVEETAGEETAGEEDPVGAGIPAADEMDAVAELAQLQEDYEGLNDRHLRLAAEFNNYRRRVEAERLDLWARAQADLMGRLLDVLDDLQRVAGLDLENATVDAIMEGIDLVERKFLRVLQDAGAEVIDPVGEPFNPEAMEAMMRVPTEDADQDDFVDQVFLKGYSLKGQLVRPARVSVRKHG